MKKFLISAIIVLVLLVVATVVYNSRKSNPTPITIAPLPIPTSTTPTPINGGVSVQTLSGTVTIADIRSLPHTKDIGSGMYHVEGTDADTTAGFAILYSAADNSFSVAIEKTPLGLYRERASQYFLKLFQISESDACKLHVLVGVPADLDQKLSGQNLGLSFCPGSTKVPE